MVLEQAGGLDRSLVSSADEDDAATLNFDRGRRRDRLGGCREQGCHLWSRLFRLARPASGLANVGKLNWVLAADLGGDIAELRGLLGTSYRERVVFRRDRLEAVEFSAAEMGR
jgi:hypothetical protein